MTIDWTKPIETQFDTPVQVLFDNANVPIAVHYRDALYILSWHERHSAERTYYFYDGRTHYELRNVIPKPVQHTGMVVVVRDSLGITEVWNRIYGSKDEIEADLESDGRKQIVAYGTVTWEEIPE